MTIEHLTRSRMRAIGEPRVGPEINARDLPLVGFDNRLQHTVPSVGAVDVAGTKRTSFQVTELVEHEERMIADAGIVAVPDAVLLFAVSRTDARIHVEHDAARRTASMNPVNPLS